MTREEIKEKLESLSEEKQLILWNSFCDSESRQEEKIHPMEDFHKVLKHEDKSKYKHVYLPHKYFKYEPLGKFYYSEDSVIYLIPTFTLTEFIYENNIDLDTFFQTEQDILDRLYDLPTAKVIELWNKCFSDYEHLIIHDMGDLNKTLTGYEPLDILQLTKYGFNLDNDYFKFNKFNDTLTAFNLSQVRQHIDYVFLATYIKKINIKF